MKKLLTTMSAVAAAMSLYATEPGPLSGTSFEGLSAGPYSITAKGSASGGELGEFTDGTTTYWVTNSTATLEIVASESSVATRPEAFDPYNQNAYLSIKTTLGNPVSRYVNSNTNTTVSMTGGLYFDSLVKFTAFDGDQEIELGTDGKLAIWLKEVLDAQDNPTATNLVITAGYIDGNGDVTKTNYTCTVLGNNPALLNDGGWHRVTVKMIDTIFDTTPTPGFVVAIDEHRVVCGETKFVVPGGDSLTRVAAAFEAEHSLFPSALQSGNKTSISAVSFDGQGCVDDLVFTTKAPSFVKDPDFFTITISNDIASAKYTLSTAGSPATITNTTGTGSVSVDVALPYNTNGFYFTISDVIAAPGFMEGTHVVDGMTVAGGQYTPTANSSLTIQAAPLGAYVDGVAYPTLAAAIAAANDASSDCTVTLAANATEKVTIDNNSAVITLDLAGYNITGTGNNEVILVDAGTLIITNSDPVTVGHVIPGSTENAVLAYGSIAITAGYFDGTVDLSQLDPGETASITGGGFSVNENKAAGSVTVPPAPNADLAAAALAAGNELIVGSGSTYYTVQAKAPVTYVAEVGGTSYETLSDAFAAAYTAGTATVKVLADVSDSTPLDAQACGKVTSGNSITLDLNGKTITTLQGSAYWLTVDSGATLVVTDSTVTATGKIESRPTNQTIFRVDGTFTMSAGTLDMTTVNAGNTASGFNVKNGGTGYMNGGTVLGRIASGETGATVEMNGGTVGIVQGKGGGVATIKGGTVTNTIEEVAKNGVTGTVTIPGTSTARFSFDATEYCEAGYCTTLNDGWYTVGLATYTITFVPGDGASVDPATTNYTIESGAITLPSATRSVPGLLFDGWTNATMTITTADLTFTPSAANCGDFTLYAKWTSGGTTYPTYLENADAAVKAQYLEWAQTYAPDTESVYEGDFLLNVAPGTDGATLSATAISISGTTVTINLNRGNLNGVPYVKKAATIAGLASAPKTAIDITPADNIENGGYFTLTGEDGTAQFYQIGVQSTPLNQN